MSLVNLVDILAMARTKGYAVGAFNVVNFQTTQAAIRAAESLRSPIILQTSVATVKTVGAVSLINFMRQLGQAATIPVAIHLDHCTDLKLALECAGLGWTSIMIDLSKQPYPDNCKGTRLVVDFCHARGISVEGELGAILGVEDQVVVGEHEVSLADPAAALDFCRKTGIDAFAPAIGTAHGLYKGTPKVEFDLLRTIADKVPCPVVVHGGTGLSEETFRRCIRQGAAKINISTAIKIAWCQSMAAYLTDHPEENNPLKSDAAAIIAVGQVVSAHLQLFGSAGMAD